MNENLSIFASIFKVGIDGVEYERPAPPHFNQTFLHFIPERNPDDDRANLFMGYGYFFTERPRESRFYLARALGPQSEAEFSVKIYQKVNNSEVLTEEVSKINRNAVIFSSA